MLAQRKSGGTEQLHHLAASLLAKVVTELVPNTQLVGEEVSEYSFSYDFVLPKDLDPPPLELLETQLHQAARKNFEVEPAEMMRENAVNYFYHVGQPLRAQWVNSLDTPTVQCGRFDGFLDLCQIEDVCDTSCLRVVRILKASFAVAHLPSVGEVKVWRVCGVAFDSQKEAKSYFKRAERAKRCDHRKLGVELQLFRNDEDAGAGLWQWLPKGAVIREILLTWWRNVHMQQEFLPVVTPRFLRPSLLKKAGFFEIPGHSDKLFPSLSIEGGDYVASPTNTPSHASLFRSTLHSYRDLPVRYSELGELYYHGKRSQLWGMCRARAYLADDTTIFCSENQVLDELISSLRFILETIRIFGFRYQLVLVQRGNKFAGTVKRWKAAIDLMQQALDAVGVEAEYQTGAFSGPKLEVCLFDALGRKWDGPCIEIDFNLPQRFALRYQGADDRMHTPWMLARSIFGSIERFVALLVEHYEGYFPLWLAPEQVRFVPLSEGHEDYLQEIASLLKAKGFRVSVDSRRETLAARIRTAEGDRIPYVVVSGDRELAAKTLTVRSCRTGNVTEKVTTDWLLNMLEEECRQTLDCDL